MNKLPNGWQIKKLKDIGEAYTGITPPTSDKENFGDEHLFITPADIKENKYISSSIRKLSNKGFEKARKFKKGDILYVSIGSTIGKMALAETDFTCNQQINVLRVNEEVDNEFIYYQLMNSFSYISKFISMQAVPIINKTTFENFYIAFPPLEEQKRIASALSKVDAYLENTIKLTESKERFKRAITKKLLTCKENKNVPEARFEGFEDEWETVKLDDICLINNKSLKGNTDKNYKFKYIDLTAVKKGNIDFSKDYITFENAPTSARRIINKNDIIMATVRPYLLGHAFIDFEAKEYICSNGFAVLTANSDIEMKYIYQYLYSDDIAKQIRTRLEGSTYPTIKSSAIKELKIKIPKSIKEQEKIGEFLSLLDAEIDNLKKQAESIKRLKKGLMKKLMSGEIRI